MKTLGIIFIIVGVVILGLLIFGWIYSNYQWENSVLSNWNLADKSSTITAKADYMDKFVEALKNNNLADNNALIYKTADNNCQNNVNAVSTLRQRLEEIKGMDVKSFEYQQAIQQITAQEQGQANDMMETLNGCWMKTHWYILWNPFLIFLWIGLIIVLPTLGTVFISCDY